MVLDAAGLSSQSRTRVRTAEERTREAWQPWRGWRVESRSELTSLPCKVAFRAVSLEDSRSDRDSSPAFSVVEGMAGGSVAGKMAV